MNETTISWFLINQPNSCKYTQMPCYNHAMGNPTSPCFSISCYCFVDLTSIFLCVGKKIHAVSKCHNFTSKSCYYHWHLSISVWMSCSYDRVFSKFSLLAKSTNLGWLGICQEPIMPSQCLVPFRLEHACPPTICPWLCRLLRPTEVHEVHNRAVREDEEPTWGRTLWMASTRAHTSYTSSHFCSEPTWRAGVISILHMRKMKFRWILNNLLWSTRQLKKWKRSRQDFLLI